MLQLIFYLFNLILYYCKLARAIIKDKVNKTETRYPYRTNQIWKVRLMYDDIIRRDLSSLTKTAKGSIECYISSKEINGY